LSQALVVSFALFSVLFLFSLGAGEISFSFSSDVFGGYRFSVVGLRPIFAAIAAKILAWDLLLFLGAVFFFRLERTRSKRAEALFTVFFCLSLWNLVIMNFRLIFFQSLTPSEMDNPSGVWETVFFVGILAISKETVFRFLKARDEQFDSPLLAFFSWHHRKDGIFNLLFGGVVVLRALGFSLLRAVQMTAAVKILLLGSAAWGITNRCWNILVDSRECKE